MKLIIENIRTFSGLHEIPIRPLTILTGENSSGKTTLLACLSVVTAPYGYPFEPRFNDPPYSLGTFDTIATSMGGKLGPADSFSLGIHFDKDHKTGPIRSLAGYRNAGGKLRLSDYTIEAPETGASLSIKGGESGYSVRLAVPASEKAFEFSLGQHAERDLRSEFLDQMLSVSIAELISSARRKRGPQRQREPDRIRHENQLKTDLDSFNRVFSLLRSAPRARTVSIAPIRTKPERTYDQTTEAFSPEGSHVPYALERILGAGHTSKDRRTVRSALERFGTDSGLFDKVNVRNLGKKGTDPFQILIDISRRSVNLLDVGYGVSQSLPVVIESLLAPPNRWLLIQQPEVHLHPRAQAALGTFFVDLVANHQREFVIETHSDYVVDRIRQEVGEGRISHDQVLILYFERTGPETTVYSLSLDELGNIIDAPATYREFFLHEEMKLLTRGSK